MKVRNLKKFWLLLFFYGCIYPSSYSQEVNQMEKTSQTEKKTNIQNSRNLFRNKVMIVAHRGDWRNAPENSLFAIQRCIIMGVDMVEIDLKMTKDGTIILMHDKTLDRTTTGSGQIKNTTFEEIKKMRLKNGYGHPTFHKIPTLEEALQLCKRKTLVFLDKGYEYVPEVVKVIKKLNMQNQVFFEGKKTLNNMKKDYGKLAYEINYMPRVKAKLDAKDYLDPFIEETSSSIFIVSVRKNNIEETKNTIRKIKKADRKVMLTTLWDTTCAGYTDDLALTDPEGNWGKVVAMGADLICTDRPRELLHYLRKKKLHD